MEDDVQRTIEKIDERIRELEATKKVLMQTFGVKSAGVIRRRLVCPGPPPLSPLSSPTRKKAIEELLRQRGPMRKVDILEQTGFPEGTVSYVLNDAEFQNIEGKWSLVEGELKEEPLLKRKSQDPPF